MFSKLFCLGLLLAMSVGAQDTTNQLLSRKSWYDRPEWKDMTQDDVVRTYSSEGIKYEKVRGVRSAPKDVVDTGRFSGGVAPLTFNNLPTKTRVPVSATTINDVHILSIQGVSADVSVDSIRWNRTLDTLRLYSADTGKVVVKVQVQ